jgi:AcrR family transcriptional regulator
MNNAETAPNKQRIKSQRAQAAICDAAIACLYAVGYGDTTLNKVATMAGFSKGALQHHFASKEDLIAATADRLLQRSVAGVTTTKAQQRFESVDASLRRSWEKLINTAAYRALLEILNAARADKALQTRISDNLLQWGRALDQNAIDTYEAVDGDDEDVKALMNMTRSFMRGLVIQERYTNDADETSRHIERWIDMIAPQLRMRESAENRTDYAKHQKC